MEIPCASRCYDQRTSVFASDGLNWMSLRQRPTFRINYVHVLAFVFFKRSATLSGYLLYNLHEKHSVTVSTVTLSGYVLTIV